MWFSYLGCLHDTKLSFSVIRLHYDAFLGPPQPHQNFSNIVDMFLVYLKSAQFTSIQSQCPIEPHRLLLRCGDTRESRATVTIVLLSAQFFQRWKLVI
jgi:hypothetical protein